MACETFVPKNFNDEHTRIILHANDLLLAMRAAGFDMTLRALYYQFIAEERWFPNNIQSYKRFIGIMSDARRAGWTDWDLLEDRIRTVEKLPHWSSPTDIMESAVASYREDLWAGQERRVHLRCEKDTLVGVIQPVCERWRVPFVACRGNTSDSEAYAAGKLFAEQISEGLWPLVIYVGDLDPSGWDMTRDNEKRLSMFSRNEIEVQRIALNIDQVQEYRLPGNPAKLTDSKAGMNKDGTIRPGSFIDLFGGESWEIEALHPTKLEAMIEEAFKAAIDFDIWNVNVEREEHNHGILESILTNWGEVEKLFGGADD